MMTSVHNGENGIESEEDELLIPAPRSWLDKNCSNLESDDDDDDDDDNDTGDSSEETNHHPLIPLAAPLPSPSWKELSSQVLPLAAKELLSSCLLRLTQTARHSYASTKWSFQYSELGIPLSGYSVPHDLKHLDLPPFSSLPWIERQMVQEWRTYRIEEDGEVEDEDIDFDRARKLLPLPRPRPLWSKADNCFACHKPFGPTRLRHHCRFCGQSFCQPHSSYSHSLAELGYNPNVPERVCDACKQLLLEQNLAERVAWRLARCRDCFEGNLVPYFETGVDTMEQAALRVTQAALAMARSIPLGAQATVAVETVDVLRKHGLNGILAIMLRQEFLAAADLLRKALGINQTAWPLSVHELSAAIFYALAQHRAMRGMNPDREEIIHTCRDSRLPQRSGLEDCNGETAIMANLVASAVPPIESESLPVQAVCDSVSDETLASILFYAPMALNFIYANKKVDMQLLAAQQGWRLVYAYLEQEVGHKKTERPASALFVHEVQRVACVAVRGTATIHDVITDIRQTPVSFPETDLEHDGEWTTIFRSHGLAVCGMATAAVNLYREHIDSILHFAQRGYRIRLTGHSLGGGVASLLGALVYRDLERCSHSQNGIQLKVYSFGTPSCVDVKLAESVEPFVTSVVLHDDVIPRLTPASCRGLLKHLLHIRETWVKEHLTDDLLAITERAKTAWAPRWRGSFTLSKSSRTIKKYCRKQILNGKRTLLCVKDKLVGDIPPEEDKFVLCSSSLSVVRVVEETPEVSASDVLGQDRNQDELENLRVFQGDHAEQEPRLLLDFMGGADGREPGLVIDGDEFFDPDENLVETSDDESSASSRELIVNRSDLKPDAASNLDKVKSDASVEDDAFVEGDDESPGTVVLEETPLPKMFIPGRVIHIYSYRGLYNAACVPRTFKELRRISMAGNMLSDHKTKNYYDALLEVQSVRRAEENPPRWTAFHEDDTCSCCASRFTWASTSDSKAQEARDKHNCRSCGTLVCDPCSKNRLPIPSIGLSVPSRVCDRCYHNMDGFFSTPLAMTSSYISSKDVENSNTLFLGVSDEKPERQREKRSQVVDELASRVHASALTCT